VRAGVKGPLSAGQSRPALYGSRFTRRPGLGGGCRGQSRCINACHAATAEGTHYLASAIARSSAGGLRDGACCPSRSSERRNVIPKMASLLTILRMEDFLSRCRYRYFAHVDAASFYLYILNIIWGGVHYRGAFLRGILGNSSLGGKYAKIVGETRAGIPVPTVTIIAMNVELYRAFYM